MRVRLQRYAFIEGFPSRSGEDFQADNRGDQRRDEEQPPETGGFLGFAEAEGESAFTQPGNNQDNPVHNL